MNMISYLLITFLSIFTCAQALSSSVKLVDNKYEGLVIGINPKLPEDPDIIEGIRQIMSDASKVLWKATNNRASFGEITILVPKTWTAGSYYAALNETYDDADILVAPANPKYGDSPYTMQYGECGVPAEHIHITRDFILNDDVVANYGPKGKTMIHEWAHLRWGVYDESVTEGYDPFYFSPTTLDPQATRCPASLRGINVVVVNETFARDCQYDEDKDWLPEEDCIFVVDVNQPPSLNASLMAYQFMDDVVAFCHDDESDPDNQHNTEAPNEHNRLCNQRSVWDVMLSSVDFKNNANLPVSESVDITPTFRVIQAQKIRFVLALDTSGSMGGLRYENMITAASTIIQTCMSYGSALGIVEFSSTAQQLSELKIINSQDDREYLLERLPMGTAGSTCIGCGILTALNVLENFGNAAGGHVIILTDSEENEATTTDDVFSTVLDKKVVVDSLFFGDFVNKELEDLTKATNGIISTSPVDNLESLIQSFIALAQSKDGDVYDKLFQVYSNTHYMGSSDFAAELATIDSTIGKDTSFTFTWSQYAVPPLVTITDPTGSKYCSANASLGCSHVGVTTKPDIKNIVFEIPETAKAGNWYYEIRTDSHTEIVNVLVTTKAADENIPPIFVESSISASDAIPGTPVVINAKVTIDYEPVLGAVVQAQVTSVNNMQVYIVDLFDDGAAPDVRKNDGVYSRYFTKYSISGQYSVQINVKGMGKDSAPVEAFRSSLGSPATFDYGYANFDGDAVLNPASPDHVTSTKPKATTTADIDAFARIDAAGTFFFSKPINETDADLYPPSRVIDLKVKQIDPLDVTQGVQLTFTSPGNDYDSGTADFYEIRYTYDKPSALSFSFSNEIPISTANLVSGDLLTPSVAKSAETFVVDLNDIPSDRDLLIVAFALRATDNAGNVAEVSNIAMMNLFLKPPEVSCTDDQGRPVNTEPFEKKKQCKTFYQCSNGQLFTKHCASESVFNPIRGVCDQLENVPACTTGVYVEDNAEPTSIPQSKPTCVSDDGLPLTTQFFPKEGDCLHYYQCVAGVLMEYTCPTGLLFNEVIQICDWPENVPDC